MTPQHAKMLLSALKENVDKYENQFGEIQIFGAGQQGGFGFQPMINPKDEKINYTRRFIWTMQSMNLQRQPLNDGNVNGDARSEPSVFYTRLITQPPLKKEKGQ